MRSLTVILGCLTVAATCPAQNWTQIKPTTSPSARTDHAMAYDSARQRTVLFGGGLLKPGSGPDVFADTWEWDGESWTQIKPTTSPSARWFHTMAYDSARRRTVLFGGFISSGSGVFLDETWEWDGKDWMQIKSTTSPPARSRHGMAYDSVRQRTVLFGGLDSKWTTLRDTWEWDGSSWTQIKPTTSPWIRIDHAMAYDSARQRTVLFGRGVLGIPAQTWEWDGQDWTQIKPTTSPTARPRHAMAYDSARQRTVLFGGLGANYFPLADTWEWDGSNWTQVKPTISPSTRVDHAMVYDSARQRTVLFSGTVFPRNPDTWEYGAQKLTLTTDTPTLSIANGGTQTLTIDGGAGLKHKLYWIFGSATSTMPGSVLTGIHIPLRHDIYTNIAIAFVNSKEFKDFKRTLSATGTATASLNVPANLGIPKGFKLYHAYVVYDGTTGQVFTSSNPVSVEFK